MPNKGVTGIFDEKWRRVRWVKELLLTKPLAKHKLIRRIKDKFGCNFRSAEGYMAEARTLIVADIKDTKDMLRADSIATYKAVINDPRSTFLEKTRAQERIDKLLGLEQPVQIQLEDTTPVKTLALADLDLNTRRALLQRLREKGTVEVMPPARAHLPPPVTLPG